MTVLNLVDDVRAGAVGATAVHAGTVLVWPDGGGPGDMGITDSVVIELNDVIVSTGTEPVQRFSFGSPVETVADVSYFPLFDVLITEPVDDFVMIPPTESAVPALE